MARQIETRFTARDHRRFHTKIRHEEAGHSTPCWMWSASRNRGGYGQFRFMGTTLLAHRVSFAWNAGGCPDDMHLDHLCRNRACVNPHHLEPVTHAENVERGEAGLVTGSKARAMTKCRRGHPYTPENTIPRPRGRRECRVCARLSERERYHRNKVTQ